MLRRFVIWTIALHLIGILFIETSAYIHPNIMKLIFIYSDMFWHSSHHQNSFPLLRRGCNNTFSYCGYIIWCSHCWDILCLLCPRWLCIIWGQSLHIDPMKTVLLKLQSILWCVKIMFIMAWWPYSCVCTLYNLAIINTPIHVKAMNLQSACQV